jgi:hypothetical protein
MPNTDNNDVIKITLDDLARVKVPEAGTGPILPASPGTRSYGTITDAAGQAPAVAEESGSILLQGWFYLGLSGLLGAVVGWGIAEPAFVDGPGTHRWGNIWLVPIILTLMCLSFGIAESTVERSAKKALLRGVLALPLGVFLGFMFYFVGNLIFNILIGITYDLGARTIHNPAFWIARGLAWASFGAAGGLIYGIVGQSSKKGTYGVIGGMIGAGIGGMVFDPISFLTHGGGMSRAVGFALVGMATGVGMGLVESALKDRWLYVTSGPLAGKQFILYKPRTTVGSKQECDIYLFKDSNILLEHATFELAGARVQVRAAGPVYLGGSAIQSRVLQDNDLLQIGRYSFRYKEKQRA